MSGHDHLVATLNWLKLTALRNQLDSLIDEAGRRELTIRDALPLFCEREIGRRDQRRIDMSYGLAHFPFVRDLTGFDFGAQPSIDKASARRIWPWRSDARRSWPGYTVLFTPATTLVARLANAQVDGRLEEHLTYYAKPKLLIIDELGYALVGVEQLLCLVRIGANEHPAAMTQAHVRDLHGHRHAAQHDDFVAPVELVGLARCERQRYISGRRLACVRPASGPGIAPNGAVAALVVRRAQLLENTDQRQPLMHRGLDSRGQQPVDLDTQLLAWPPSLSTVEELLEDTSQTSLDNREIQFVDKHFSTIGVSQFPQDLAFSERLVTDQSLSDLVDHIPMALHQTLGPRVHRGVASEPSSHRAATWQEPEQPEHVLLVVLETRGLTIRSRQPLGDATRKGAKKKSLDLNARLPSPGPERPSSFGPSKLRRNDRRASEPYSDHSIDYRMAGHVVGGTAALSAVHLCHGARSVVFIPVVADATQRRPASQ
jgi:hypothetical protein